MDRYSDPDYIEAIDAMSAAALPLRRLQAQESDKTSPAFGRLRRAYRLLDDALDEVRQARRGIPVFNPDIDDDPEAFDAAYEAELNEGQG